MSAPGRRPGELNAAHVRRRFDRAAATFDGNDYVHRHAAKGLFERMSPMLVDVGHILDLGAATGTASRELARRFRRSRIVSLDLSREMLRRARSNRSRFARITELQADAAKLPFRDHSIDLAFANMTLPWVDDMEFVFSGVNRVLRKDGLFVFSTLGPDSLEELRHAWAGVDAREHVNAFIDMHDVGDALVRAGLREPVLDVDYLTVTWKDAGALFRDLTLAGARNSLRERPRSLTGRGHFREMQRRLDALRKNGVLPLRLELVFGHAWGGGARQEAGEFRVDPGSIGRRLR